MNPTGDILGLYPRKAKKSHEAGGEDARVETRRDIPNSVLTLLLVHPFVLTLPLELPHCPRKHVEDLEP